MLQLKKISVNLTLVVSMVAFAGINNVQAEKIKLPLPTEDSQIRGVVEGMSMGPNADVVKEIMVQTRDITKEAMAQRLPLMPQLRNTIGNKVSTKVMEETRRKTMNTQMEAMQDPANPEGVPEFIAPKFDFE